jgi:hypothetical protein
MICREHYRSNFPLGARFLESRENGLTIYSRMLRSFSKFFSTMRDKANQAQQSLIQQL